MRRKNWGKSTRFENEKQKSEKKKQKNKIVLGDSFAEGEYRHFSLYLSLSLSIA